MVKSIFMIQVKLFATAVFIACFTSDSCSQTEKDRPLASLVYEASTPCNVALKTMLQIPGETKCDFVKWNLVVKHDQKTLKPSTYTLSCTYGLAKQRTRGFMDGAATLELKGKLTIERGDHANAEAIVYKLTADNAPVTLYFVKAGENLLHLLDPDKRLMVGSIAWSFTLNRKDPVSSSSAKTSKKIISAQLLTTDSAVAGVFEGRTPCNDALRELNGIAASDCQIIKCQLILYQDVKTHQPSSFLLNTIYVGAGDTKYSNTGKWVISQGAKDSPKAMVYELTADKPNVSLMLLKGDDNILFFLDKDDNFLVGNSYVSYTLNRAKK